MMMMAANLVGFVVGVDGVSFFASQLFGTFEGEVFVRFTVSCLILTLSPTLFQACDFWSELCFVCLSVLS